MPAMRASLRFKILGQGIIPILFLFGLAGLGVYSTHLLLAGMGAVDHSHETIEKILAIQSDAANMQNGMRGYLLTGDEKNLESFKKAEQEVAERLKALAILVGVPSRKKLLEDAEAILKNWKETVADPYIALRREIGDGKNLDDISALVAKRIGLQLFGKFRKEMGEFIERQQSIITRAQIQATKGVVGDDSTGSPSFVARAQETLDRAQQIMSAALNMETGQRGYLLAGEDDFLEPYEVGSIRVFSLLEEQKRAVSDDPEMVRATEAIQASLRDWVKKCTEPEIALRRKITASKTLADLRALVSKGEDEALFAQLRQILTAFNDSELATMRERKLEADRVTGLVQSMLVGGAAVAAAAILLIAFFLSGTITKPLLSAMGLAEAISDGDLSSTLPVKSRDEVGRLCSSLNSMVVSLREQIGRLKEGAMVLAAAASEISSTVSQVARNAAQTSVSVTETTTTVEQVKQAAMLAGEKAKHVVEMSRQAVHISESGGQATLDTIERMHLIKEQMTSIRETVLRLSEHSRSIEDIMDTVHDLAGQSNLLAVNASIEAARAGDQGKGFAVVALEIKNLADQSKQATEQVGAILEDTRKWVNAVMAATDQGATAVEAGVQQSSVAGQAIETLSGSVLASAQAASVIEATSEQQSIGVHQVSTAMGNIQNAVQQNSDAATQLEGAVQRLSGLGSQFQELVERYRM
jgi:methyl-accepting chemotaxis protein